MGVEVRLSYNSLIHNTRPDIPLLWPNMTIIHWAKETGYEGVEFLPFRGAARDILEKPVQIISKIPEIKSGHVFYNPYATIWNVITKQADPLRPGTRLATYNLLMVEPKTGQKVLHKLERSYGSGFPIVTYPYRIGESEPYGQYKNPWLQTHPAVFNDESNENELINLVRGGAYSGVVWDTFHAMEETKSGIKPLFNWKKSLAKLLEAGVIKEIHLQAARSTEKYGKVPDKEWAKDLTGENPKYNSEIGKLIKLVKSFNQNIPFVVEVSPQGLYNSGILKGNSILRTTGDFQDIHRQIIDYVKRV